jgi:transposase
MENVPFLPLRGSNFVFQSCCWRRPKCPGSGGKTGFVSRSGAPSKLTDEQRQQLGEWVESEALSSRELLTRLEREYQVVMGRTTLRMELKRLGYVWKRTRYSLKKNGTLKRSSKPGSRSMS